MIDFRRNLKFFNVALRGATLISKLSLILILAKFLSPGELGLYGLLVATVAYGIYPLGLEFYTFGNRELILTDDIKKGALIKSQLFFHLLMYILFLPMFLFLFYFELLPWILIFWFYLILILEHLNQEIFRILVAMSKQVTASIALFFRHGMWALVVAATMYLENDARNLKFVLLAWAVGNIISFGVVIFVLIKLPISGWTDSVNWSWVKRGLKVATPYFMATIGVNGILTIDKYIFDLFNGKEHLGAYVFFLAISAALVSFLDAGVFSFTYPQMISSVNNKEPDQLNKLMKKMTRQVLLCSAAYLVVVHFAMSFLLGLIGKDIYTNNISLFYLFFIAMFIQSLSFVPHYGLYAKKIDRPIVHSGVLSFCFFVFFCWTLSYISTLYAIPFAFILTYLFVFLWKLFHLRSSYE